MNRRELSESLAKAGLRLEGVADTEDPLIPPTLATFAASCDSDDGAFGGSVSLDDTSLRDKANAEWYRLARQGELLGGVGAKFLVAVDCLAEDSPRWWWVRVELLDEWDIAGKGAASGILGNAPCRPSFVMLSLDGRVIMRCDLGQASVDFSVVPEARYAHTLRQHGEWMAGSPRVDDCTRAAIGRWLGGLPDRTPSRSDQ